MVDSGPPAHWPFVLFDPPTFKKPQRKVTRVFLHCSAWDNAAFNGTALVEEINRWHIAQGWRGVGYHFLIDKQGHVATGRPLEETPAAQLGPDKMGNVATIAIMTQGLWHFTEASLKTLTVLCKAIDDEYTLNRETVTFHGHCEIDPKPCPVFDYKGLLGLDMLGHLFSNPCVSPAEVADKATKMEPGGGHQE